ncbi:MAG TPA: nicotinamide riboside transporter PnuC [Thermoanaerobaculia bacterium]|nr:nicotinamide riboside transporter PnuC [Thermoanaerobaculia bacterium]
MASAPAVSPLEITAASILMISVVLSARENIWSWPTAIIGVAMYIVVCYDAKLYADMGLQFIYVVINIYGWWEWLHGGKDKGELHVSKAPLRILIAGSVVALAGTAAFGYFFQRYTPASFPFADSALSCFSLLAQYLMARKYLENWYLWIAVDVFYVPMYMAKHLYPTAILYAAFIAPCVMGVVQWQRAMNGVRATA